ncbi:MAG: 1-acyl-sn-glycerol-3-phosphate acyltransferase [Rickettsiales bacterium]|nr:1-acyl-sn-glycerol-3-phosphate acyltransferase [Rickettsiales bacterium]
MKLFRIFSAAVRFGVFFAWIFAQVPVLLIIAPFGRRLKIWQMHIFMSVSARLFGVRFRVKGKLSEHRPLLLVSNHISIFEIIIFPALFKCGFFAKSEVKKWFPVNLFIAGFGNLFIDRRPTRAIQVISATRKQMENTKNAFVMFPEGTTNNGNYVLPFKSAIFDFLSGAEAVRIQPIAIIYRDKNGKKIPPQILADEYAYMTNSRQSQPPYTTRELSIVQLVWRTLIRGGFLVEVYVSPTFNHSGLDRKQIAAKLHEIVSKKFNDEN